MFKPRHSPGVGDFDLDSQLSLSNAKFFCDGHRLAETATPASLDMEEDDEFQIGILFPNL